MLVYCKVICTTDMTVYLDTGRDRNKDNIEVERPRYISELIKMWSMYGPCSAHGKLMKSDEVIQNVVAHTNQSKGSLLALLSELDVQILAGLKAGRIVRLPNGTRFEPVGDQDGYIHIRVTVSPEMEKLVNATFWGDWVNAENIGKSETEMIEFYNGKHPDAPFSVD